MNPATNAHELRNNVRQVSSRYLPHLSILVGHSQQRCIGNKNENLQGLLDKRLFEQGLPLVRNI